jgi:hypothetical protein
MNQREVLSQLPRMLGQRQARRRAQGIIGVPPVFP